MKENVDMDVSLGIIGMGFMGRTHLGAFSKIPGCRILAVADRNPECLQSAPARDAGNIEVGGGEGIQSVLEGVTRHDAAQDLIEDSRLDLVVVTTPTPTHIEIASSAVRAGRHVLVEKPVDLERSAILGLLGEASAAGVMVMPAHCMRFWPAWRWMRDAVRDRRYGACVKASFLRCGPKPSWNADFYLDVSKSGDAIVDLHIHDTDFVMHCFGRPTTVRSSGSSRYLRTAYEFAGGPEVVAEGGWLDDDDAPFRMMAELVFESGILTFELGRDPEVVFTSAEGQRIPLPEASHHGTGYDGQAIAFIEAIRNDASTPPVSLQDAAETALVLASEQESIRLDGAAVDIVPV